MLRSRLFLLLCVFACQPASLRADDALTPAQAATKLGRL